MNTLNETAKYQTLIENLRGLCAQLQQSARVRGKPAPSPKLLEEAALTMSRAAECIEYLLLPIGDDAQP